LEDVERTSAAPGARVVVYCDYVSPFCYLAEPGLRRLRDEAGVWVERRAYELWPAPTELPDPREAERDWATVVEPLARELGLELRCPRTQPRTRKAHEAAVYAREHGRFDEFHEALYRAHFVEGLDIGRIDVLAELGARLGLDAQDLRIALGVDRYTEQVLAEEAEALRRGVRGVPAYVVGGRLITGLQRYEDLLELIQRSAADAGG
jgi:predicted DsbA family dithiol-disulfide isomerase